MAARSLSMSLSRTRNFSFITELPVVLDCPGDRADPRAQVHVSFKGLLERPPEGGLRLDIVAVDRHVHVGAWMETSGLEDGAEEIDGTDRREARSRPADRLLRPFEHRPPERFPLRPQLALALGMILTVGSEGRFVHHPLSVPSSEYTNSGSWLIRSRTRFEAVTPRRRTGRVGASVRRRRSRAQRAMEPPWQTGTGKVRERVTVVKSA